MASVYAQRPFDDARRAADWNGVLDVDLRAAFLCAHAAAPHMRRQGGGRIINFSDWIGEERAACAIAAIFRTTSRRPA